MMLLKEAVEIPNQQVDVINLWCETFTHVAPDHA